MTENYCVEDERAHQSSKIRTLTYVQDIEEMLPEMNNEIAKVGALAELVENNKEMPETLRLGLANMLRDIHTEYSHWQENVDMVVGFAKRYTTKTERDDGMKEVILTINPEHYHLIEKLAGIQQTSVETLMLDAAKSGLSVLLPDDADDWEGVEAAAFDIHPQLKTTAA